MEYVSNFSKNNFASGKTLGVHFRGQEHKKAPDHPSCPTVEQMLERANFFLDSYPIDCIFIVTEEKAYLDIFVKTFGNRVLFTDTFRTYEANAYSLRPYPRGLHMYNLGLDVLRDTLLLSQTDYLLASGKDGVASGSNVSRMAQVLNGNQYAHAELIYNGINKPGWMLHLRRITGKMKRIAKAVYKEVT